MSIMGCPNYNLNLLRLNPNSQIPILYLCNVCELCQTLPLLLYITQTNASKHTNLVTSRGKTMRYKREVLVREARPLARANSVITIGGSNMHSLSTKHYHEREFGLCWSKVTKQPSLDSTKLDHCQRHVQWPYFHAILFLVDTCSSQCSRVAFHLTTLTAAIFLSPLAIVQQLY